MSSNCPPQLQLSIPPSTTSFKRSFEQFGFDLDSPVSSADAGGSGGTNGNDRNKRARSASSFSDGSDSLQGSQSSGSTSGSGSSSTSESDINLHNSQPVVSGPSSSLGTSLSMTLTHTSLEPPRLPTPDVDIEIPDYHSMTEDNAPAPFPPSNLPSSTQIPQNNAYRLTLERFNAFETEIAALRRSSSPQLSRSPALPPTLPPLELSEDQEHLNTNAIPFVEINPRNNDPSSSLSQSSSYAHAQPAASNRNPLQGQGHRPEIPRLHIDLPRSSFTFPSHSATGGTPNATENDNTSLLGSRANSRSQYGIFADELYSLFDYRSPSPQPRDSSSSHPPATVSATTAHPPTLPPILTVHDNSTWDDEVIQFHHTTQDDRSVITPSSTSFMHSGPGPSVRQNLTLRDHVPPSPSLRELRQWMDVSDIGEPSRWEVETQDLASASSSSRSVHQNQFEGPSSIAAEASSTYADTSSNATRSRSPEWPSSVSEAAWRAISPENHRSLPFLETLRDLEDTYRLSGRRTPVTEAAVRRLDHSLFNPHPSEASPSLQTGNSRSSVTDESTNRISESRSNVEYSTRTSSIPALSSSREYQSRRTSAFRPIEMDLEATSDRWLRDLGPFASEDRERSPERAAESTSSQDTYAWTRRHRLRQPPLRSSNSLVAESASEARRRTDQASLLHGNWAAINRPSLQSFQSLNQDSVIASSSSPASRLHRQATTSEGLRNELQRRVIEAHTIPRSRDGNRERWLRQEFMNVYRPPSASEPSPEDNQLDMSEDELSIGHDTGGSSRNSSYSSLPSQGMQVNSSSSFHPMSSLPPLSSMTTVHRSPVASTRNSGESNWTEEFGFNTLDVGDPSSLDDEHYFRTTHGSNNNPEHVSTDLFLSSNERDVEGHSSSSHSRSFLPIPSLPSPNLDVEFSPSTQTSSSSEDVLPSETVSQFHLRRQALLDRRRRQLDLLIDGQGDSAPPVSLPPSVRLERSRRSSSIAVGRSEPRGETLGNGLSRSRTTAIERHSQLQSALRNAHTNERRASESLSRRTDSSPTRGSPRSVFSTNAARATRPLSGFIPPPSSHLTGLSRSTISIETQSDQPHTVPLDPDMFAPGPFRNTMRHSHQSQRPAIHRLSPLTASVPQPPARPSTSFMDRYGQDWYALRSAASSSTSSSAPTIPPLTFASDILNNLQPRVAPREFDGARRTSEPSRSRSTADVGLHSFLDPSSRPDPTSQRRISRFRPAPSDTPPADHSLAERHRPDINLHRYLQGHASPDDPQHRLPFDVSLSSRADDMGPRPRPYLSSPNDSSNEDHVGITEQMRQYRAARAARGVTGEALGTVNRTADDRDISFESFRRMIRSRGPRNTDAFLRRRGNLNLGDYMRDEDFDESYESLITLATQLGEVKPRHTPTQVIESLESAQYKDWATSDSDQRCPICLDDYEPTDQVLKLNNCSHWQHKECLQQWLQSATTCPVCRMPVHGANSSSSTRLRNFSSFRFNPTFRGPHRRQGPPDGSAGSGGSGGTEGTANTSTPTTRTSFRRF